MFVFLQYVLNRLLISLLFCLVELIHHIFYLRVNRLDFLDLKINFALTQPIRVATLEISRQILLLHALILVRLILRLHICLVLLQRCSGYFLFLLQLLLFVLLNYCLHALKHPFIKLLLSCGEVLCIFKKLSLSQFVVNRRL